MKKKRGLKTQLIVTSLVLTCFLSSFSIVRAAYAFSPHYFSYTHGSVSIGTYVEEASNATSTSFDIATVCDFNFDAYYSGTVTLKWTHSTSNYQQHLTEWSVVAVGAKIDSLSSGQVVFRVYDQKEFQVILHYWTGPLASTPSDDPGFDFTSATSSLTAVTNHNSEYNNINSIDTKLTTTNNTLSTLASRLQTSNGFLTDILSNTNDIESYLAAENNGVNDTDVEILLNSIKTIQTNTATNISDCEDYLNQIKGQVTTIRSLLGTIDINDPEQMTIIDAINSIAASQASLETKLDTISGQLTTMSSTLNTISTTLINLLSTVQNIDSLIDTISWDSTDVTFMGWTQDFETFVNAGTNVIDYYVVYRLENNSVGLSNRLFKMYVNADARNVNNNAALGVYYVSSSNHTLYPVNVYYSNNSRRDHSYYFDLTDKLYPFTEPVYMAIKFQNISFGVSNIPNFVCGWLKDSDIEYWQLISYFDQMKQYSTVNTFDQQLYSKLNDILTAINNINTSVNVSDQDVQDITRDFDTDIDTIHNIENNYGLNFDGWDDQLTPADLTMDLSGYSDTVNLFKTNISALWQSPLVSLPILLSCLCFIFLVILG